MKFDRSPSATLYLIVDPLCGWTYAAQPIFKKALTIENLNIKTISGGMLAFDQSRAISKDWKHFVSPIDQRITQLSGMTFGEGYKKRLNDTGYILDSEPSSKAMIVAQNMNQSSLIMLAAIQDAYFEKGLDINDGLILSELASSIGLEPYTFFHHYQKVTHDEMIDHFDKAAKLLASIKGHGYPSAILELNDQKEAININRFYGNPNLWQQTVLNKLDSALVAEL